MAPTASKSPETRTESVSVPGPALAGRSASTDTVATEDPRGVKRKNGEDEPKPAGSISLGLIGVDKEREAAKDRAYSHSPLAAHDARPTPAANANLSLQRQTAESVARENVARENAARENAARLHSSTAGRYSIYGPTMREGAPQYPSGNSLWNTLNGTLGQRRDGPPAAPPNAARPAATLDGAHRQSPDTHRDPRFYPSAATSSTSTSVSGYGHYSMGRRELGEHREQLREGKRWLEAMLAKTDKMLHMVENKMALTGESPGLAHAVAPAAAAASSMPSNPSNGTQKDDREFDERERARQTEIQRLEGERERDRLERDKQKREKEFEQERERREKERERGLAALGNRDRSEAERNRDLLLASRRVTAVSPNGRERSTPTATAGGTVAAAAGSETATKQGGAWDGNPVMAGVALPRRDQGPLSRQLGRGFWSFDVRG